MGTLAAAGTSNSKSATEPPDASASSRNRIANCPILISSLLGVVTMPTPPLLVFSVLRLIDLSSTSFLYLLSWARLVSPAYSYVHLDYDGSRQGAHGSFASFFTCFRRDQPHLRQHVHYCVFVSLCSVGMRCLYPSSYR